MDRKKFNYLLFGGTLAGLASCSVYNRGQISAGYNTSVIKPPRLKKGDMVGLIAPGSPFSKEAYERAVKNIQNLGLKYKNADNLFEKYGYLAGSDKNRVEDIHQMFEDKNINAIWCVRGGYGTTRLLDMIDYDLIRANPKIIIGYSDITALLNAITQRTGLVTFHGPVASTTMTPYVVDNFKRILMQNSTSVVLKPYDFEKTTEDYQKMNIAKGSFKGQLVGGNLSLLSAMAGTAFEVDVKGKIVFIEDVGEKPYRIDRMLTQLIQAYKLEKASGVILGVFNDCEADEDDLNTLTLKETLKDRLGNLGIPVYYGFTFGHIDEMVTLPIGIDARFDAKSEQLMILESCVV